MPTRALLVPGTPTPERRVPAHIARPEYVGKAAPAPNTWPDVQPPEVIEAMRVAGRIAAQALAAGGAAVAPGVTTDEIDRVVHEFLVDHDAYPSTLGYKGFPKSCCTSLNEVVCHGIPDTTVIEDGDIVNIDVTAFIGGVHGDTNATFLAGDVDEESRLLVERTREATMRAIKAVRPGRELSVVGRVIESYAKRFGYGVVREYTGHGIGRSFHGGLVVLHYDDPDVHIPLEPGMTFTIEPMITVGSSENEKWADDWTVVTARRVAHRAVRAHHPRHGGRRRRSSRCPDSGHRLLGRQREEPARAPHVLRVAGPPLADRALQQGGAGALGQQPRHQRGADEADQPGRVVQREQREPPPDRRVAEVVGVPRVAPQARGPSPGPCWPGRP